MEITPGDSDGKPAVDVDDAHPGSRSRRPLRGGLGSPVLRPRAGGPAERFAARFGGRASGARSSADARGLALIAGLSTGLGDLVKHVVLPCGGVGFRRRAGQRLARGPPDPSRTDVSLIGSRVGRSRAPDPRRATALAFAGLRHWRLAAYVVFGLAVESASTGSRRSSFTAIGRTSRASNSCPSNASYPSGHTAASVAVYSGLALLLTSRFANRGLRVPCGAPRSLIPCSSRCRACIAACIIRSTSPAASLLGIASAVVLVFACRAAGAAADARRPGIAVKVASSRTPARRSAAGCSSCGARSSAHGVADPSGTRCRRAARRPRQVRRALEAGADLVFAWGGDGMVQRCVDVARRNRCEPRDRARRHREPVRVEPRHPAGHRAGGRRSACTARAAGSTSAASTASASP